MTESFFECTQLQYNQQIICKHYANVSNKGWDSYFTNDNKFLFTYDYEFHYLVFDDKETYEYNVPLQIIEVTTEYVKIQTVEANPKYDTYYFADHAK